MKTGLILVLTELSMYYKTNNRQKLSTKPSNRKFNRSSLEHCRRRVS